jgi:arylsulfatase A-like enzyme
MNIRLCWSSAMLLAFALLQGQTAAADSPPAQKPNVVFILADDLGYSDLGCYGSEIATPNLDRLAANGLRFTQFYNTARCWPSRAAFLTGYYAQQVNRDPQGTRPRWAALLPELLSGAGYRSYHSGKWHVDGNVLAGGFSRSYHVTDHNRYFTPRDHQLDDRPLAPPKPDENYYATTAVGQRSVEWLAEHHSQHKTDPFFLYVAFTSPHFPLQAPAEDIARYRERYLQGWEKVRDLRWQRMKQMGIVRGEISAPEPVVVPPWNLAETQLQKQVGPAEVGHAVAWSDLTEEQKQFQATKMAIHAAMIDRMDQEIGRVLAKLKEMGASENTLIFFASDNGASAEQIIRGDGHDPNAAAGSAGTFLGLGPGWSTVSNTPFRRHKSWTHEGGIATPLVVQWPAGISARGELRHAPDHLVDIVPTLLELAGIAPPPKWNDEPRPSLPGRSLSPFFASDALIDHAPIFFKHIGNRGLRVGDWKIVASGEDVPWELYNLASDRAETDNLATKNPAKVSELAAIWSELDAEYARQGATGGTERKKQKSKQAKGKTAD